VKNQWVEPDLRDDVVSKIESWHTLTAIPRNLLLNWAQIRRGTYYDWKNRQGIGNQHSKPPNQSHWILPEEKQAVIQFAKNHPGEGYRRLTYMMIDADIAYLSPATTYRILSKAGMLGRAPKPSKKGTGFHQPSAAHKHWHIDFTYINLSGTFYFLCAIIDGYSRAILAWDIAATMTSEDAQIILQRAHEAYPDASPRIISDNGKQFVGREFTSLLKNFGFTQATTSPYYPQSNGKIERFNGSLKNECIYPTTPLTLEDALRVVARYIEHYNHTRLHSAIGYVPPMAVLKERREAIHTERDDKLAKARSARLESYQNQISKPQNSIAV